MTSPTIVTTSSSRVAWTAVCHLAELVPERGVAALIDDEQVALFRLHSPADTVLAVQQLDPYSGAYVMARGIVGTRGDAPTVASPMYKQVFDLRTGHCLDAVGREPAHLRTWPVRVEGGLVMVGITREGDNGDVGDDAGRGTAAPAAASRATSPPEGSST